MRGLYPGDTRFHSGDYEPYDAETAPQEYSGLQEEFDYPESNGGTRWKWVAAAAACIFAVAVVATAVILSGGEDKTPATAMTTPPSSLTPINTTTPPPPPPTTSAPPPSTSHKPSTPAAETPSTAASTPPPATATAEPPPSNPLLPPDNQRAINPGAFTYYVTGNQQPGDFLTITYTDGTGRSRTVLGANLPWTMIVTPMPGVSAGSVTATSFASQINCSISNNESQMLAVQNANSVVARCAK